MVQMESINVKIFMLFNKAYTKKLKFPFNNKVHF